MNAFIAFLRRLGLGGIIVLILSYVLRGGPPGGAVKIYLFASIGVYIVAVILTWISSNHAIEMASGILGEELPAKSLPGCWIRSLFIDITSPISVVVQLFRDFPAKYITFFSTYIVIIGYIVLWFVVFPKMY